MGSLCSLCKPVGSAFAGSNPAPTIAQRRREPLEIPRSERSIAACERRLRPDSSGRAEQGFSGSFWARRGNLGEVVAVGRGIAGDRVRRANAGGRALVGRLRPALLPCPSAEPARFHQVPPGRAEPEASREAGHLKGSRGGASRTRPPAPARE